MITILARPLLIVVVLIGAMGCAHAPPHLAAPPGVGVYRVPDDAADSDFVCVYVPPGPWEHPWEAGIHCVRIGDLRAWLGGQRRI